MARKPKRKRSRKREPDPAALLAALASALDRCDRAGLGVELRHGIVITGAGYVLPVGGRWAVRMLRKHK